MKSFLEVLSTAVCLLPQKHDGDHALPETEAVLSASAWDTTSLLLAKRPELLGVYLQQPGASSAEEAHQLPPVQCHP